MLDKKIQDIEIKQLIVSEDQEYAEFEAYASTFDFIDSYRDVVRKGAFINCLENSKLQGEQIIPMLWSHKTDKPIGKFSINEMIEDDKGLLVKGKILLAVQEGREAYALMKSGIITKLSIGYIVKRDSFDKETKTRNLLEVDLKEISLVMMPANSQAKILSVKSMDMNTIKISSIDKLFNQKEAENNILSYKADNFNLDDCYFLVNKEQKEGLFVDIVDNEPEINIKAVMDFSRKANIEKMQLNEIQRDQLYTKINSLYEIIRKQTQDNSYISPYEVQQDLINNFSIKECEKFLKKAGLTNAGFNAFFDRLLELKACKPKKKNEDKDLEKEIISQTKNSLDENKIQLTPEEFKKLNESLEKLLIKL